MPPPIEVQAEPQARAPVHDTTSSTYACTNRAMSGGELGNFQPYLRREEPSRMEPPKENPTNPLHQNFHAQAKTMSFEANSENQENLENSHKKIEANRWSLHGMRRRPLDEGLPS